MSWSSLNTLEKKKREVAAKLKQGVSQEKKFRQRESVSGNLSKHHLIAHKHLANIESVHGLQNIQHHSNDQQCTSLDRGMEAV